MTRLRTTIAATLLAAVALIAPAASHAADPGSTEPREQLISTLGWGWGG